MSEDVQKLLNRYRELYDEWQNNIKEEFNKEPLDLSDECLLTIALDAKFYYDTMGNPISLNNRVALVPDKNPCFSYFMGMRYLLTDKENLPAGYKTVRQRGKYILAQNENVLPVCYGTAELLGKEEYEKLDFPDMLEALCSKAVVSQTQEIQTFMANAQEETAEDFFAENGGEKILGLSGKKERYTLRLNKSYQGKILIISFHVESNNKKEVIISINGIKNKLSSESAPYPNNNHDFTYILCSANYIDELDIEAEKGDYTVNNLKIYTLDEEYLCHSDIVMPQVQEQESGNKGSVFQGNIMMKKDGYFITSYPYRKGYQVKVDREPVEAEKVNTAFVGFPITAGEHQIEITYEAPGFKLGCVTSIISFLFLGMVVIWEKGKSE